MVEIDDIVDRDSFDAWLKQEDLPREAMVALAHRAAMRVLPIVWGGFGIEAWSRITGSSPITILRHKLMWSVAPKQNFMAGQLRMNLALATFANANAASSLRQAEHGSEAIKAYENYAGSHATVIDTMASRDLSNRSMLEAASASAAMVGQFLDQSDAAWDALREDCSVAPDFQTLLSRGLWGNVTNPLRSIWAELAAEYPKPLLFDGRFKFDGTSASGGQTRHPYAFWLDWYQRALDGTEDRWPLLREIALLDKDADGQDIWESPERLAAEIARLEAEYEKGLRAEAPVEAQLARMPPPSEASVAKVKTAMERHRRDLPPTFDALSGFLALEIDRLQKRNYRDDDDRAECERQIAILLTIAKTVEQLKALVPQTDTMDMSEAEEATKLGQLFVDKFKAWPRANADELVDSSYRGALIGATTMALPMIGIATPYAFAAGLVLFGGKKMADAIKSAKGAIQ